jgi:hypothetical protein
VEVEPAFDLVARESWCHQSQINEWLPWVARRHIEPTADLDAWKARLRSRFQRQARELGPARPDRAWEVFTVTAWCQRPSRLDQLLRRDSPRCTRIPSRHGGDISLHKLRRWSGHVSPERCRTTLLCPAVARLPPSGGA